MSVVKCFCCHIKHGEGEKAKNERRESCHELTSPHKEPEVQQKKIERRIFFPSEAFRQDVLGRMSCDVNAERFVEPKTSFTEEIKSKTKGDGNEKQKRHP